MLGPPFISESVFYTQSVMLSPRFIPESVFYTQSVVRSPYFMLTDGPIQEVICEKCKDSTVTTIAHRLNTIMDYDKVLVLDGGHVVEFEKPGVFS